MEKMIKNVITLFLILLSMAVSSTAVSEEQAAGSVFKPEELEQILAPVALYPDSLLSQVLMASTYPLEVVQAQRWAESNKALTGDALATELEKQTWDPSVKSLVNFPEVLTMMNEKIDWTQKLGDAFLAQQKDVMDTVQKLRTKAQTEGNLKTTEQQVVKVEQQTIIIEYANPKVVYVPTYDPVVIYGTWPYPAYPPYYYYPPSYAPGNPYVAFTAGVAVGAAWGYAWGNCDWHGGDVDIDINQNTNFNQNIDRGKYATQFQGGNGNWQHNPEHRKGASYRDQGTAQKFNRASTNDAIKSREEFRGRSEQGRRDLARGDADQFKGRTDTGSRGNLSSGENKAASRDVSSPGSSARGGAFDGMDRGSSARNNSSRGSTSRQSMSRPSSGGSRGGGGGRR